MQGTVYLEYCIFLDKIEISKNRYILPSPTVDLFELIYLNMNILCLGYFYEMMLSTQSWTLQTRNLLPSLQPPQV